MLSCPASAFCQAAACACTASQATGAFRLELSPADSRRLLSFAPKREKGYADHST